MDPLAAALAALAAALALQAGGPSPRQKPPAPPVAVLNVVPIVAPVYGTTQQRFVGGFVSLTVRF